MPIFCFNVVGDDPELDREPHEFPSLEHAKAEAARFAGEMVKDQAEQIWQDEQWAIEVRDERGLILAVIMLVGYDAPAACRQRAKP